MMKSTQEQKAVVPGYSDSILQYNHINKCAQKMLKITVKLVPVTESYVSRQHAQLKSLTQIS